jgi:hypothetical protein
MFQPFLIPKKKGSFLHSQALPFDQCIITFMLIIIDNNILTIFIQALGAARTSVKKEKKVGHTSSRRRISESSIDTPSSPDSPPYSSTSSSPELHSES